MCIRDRFNVVGEDYHFALGINVDITHMVRATQMLSELTATSGELQQTLMQDSRSQLEELLRECILSLIHICTGTRMIRCRLR